MMFTRQFFSGTREFELIAGAGNLLGISELEEYQKCQNRFIRRKNHGRKKWSIVLYRKEKCKAQVSGVWGLI